MYLISGAGDRVVVKHIVDRSNINKELHLRRLLYPRLLSWPAWACLSRLSRLRRFCSFSRLLLLLLLLHITFYFLQSGLDIPPTRLPSPLSPVNNLIHRYLEFVKALRARQNETLQQLDVGVGSSPVPPGNV